MIPPPLEAISCQYLFSKAHMGPRLSSPSMLGFGMTCADHHSCEFTSLIAMWYLKPAFHSSPPHSLALIFFPFPLSQCTLRLGDEGLKTDVPFRVEYSVSYSQNLEELFSPLTVANCKRKLLSSRLRAAKISGYKHKYFKGKLTAWPYNGITIAGNTLGPISFPAMYFWL